MLRLVKRPHAAPNQVPLLRQAKRGMRFATSRTSRRCRSAFGVMVRAVQVKALQVRATAELRFRDRPETPETFWRWDDAAIALLAVLACQLIVMGLI